MKKILPFIILIFSFLFSNSLQAQILCIYCYQQNDSISHNVNNLVLNGSFENTNCLPNVFSNSFCPVSSYYSCTVNDWTCTGGGIDTYASIDDNTFTQTADGIYAAYLGNGTSATVCSSTQSDTSCFTATGCELLNIPQGYPTTEPDFGGSAGVSIEQTIGGLTVGSTYVLEFWAGGEPQAHGWTLPGVFGVDIGFGYTFLRNNPTCPTCTGTVYIIVFNATSALHTIKFTNWGHVCIPCTELIVDNVRLYPYSEISPAVPPCAGATVSALFSAPHHICPGTCTNFTNLSTNATSFIWNFSGGNPSVSTDVNPANICYSTPGTYDVSLIAAGATTSDTLLLPNYITVFPLPPAQGIIQSGDTLFAIPGALGYQWYHNGSLINGATDYFYVATASGNYNVVAADTNGCEVEAGIFDVIAELDPLPGELTELKVFPNPVTGRLYVERYPLFETAIAFSVYNIVGEEIKLPVNSEELSVDCSSLPSGIYYLHLKNQDRSFHIRFVKSD